MQTHEVEPGQATPAEYRRLFEPLQIGTLAVRNRILNATHFTFLEDDRDLRYLQERAAGGAGLIGLEAHGGVSEFSVSPIPASGRSDWDSRPLPPTGTRGIEHYDAVVVPRLARRAEVIHDNGAKCYGQVYHRGAAPHAQRMTAPIGPSGVLDLADGLPSHELTEEEIDELITVFAHGIRRVRDAGLDAAEIHGAHGYLVSQFLSPSTNLRTDRWGGSIEHRAGFAVEIVARARQLVGPDFPIGIRVGVDADGHGRGLTIDGLADVCALLGPHMSFISVSGGTLSGFGDGYELAYVSPWYRTPGQNVASAAAVKAVVDVPVFVTGRITDPSHAEAILADDAADMIGMVRALIADPHLPNKIKSGRTTEVRTCLGLSECHHIGPHRTPVTCAVNPAAGREAEMEITRSTTSKSIVVVGAGPAGMEAARVSALRGHTVYLADRERFIGGTPRLLARDPNRRSLRDHAAYYEGELDRLGVHLMLGNLVTAQELVDFAPDHVIIATGGSPRIPLLDGIDSPNVVTALDVFRGTVVHTDNVLVVGGSDTHLAGGTIAEFLADQGKSVELISEHFEFASGAETGTRLPLMHRLMNKNVQISLTHSLIGVHDGDATLRHTMTRRERTVEGVTVVLACGLVPSDSLAKELGSKLAVHVVGDAFVPRRIAHATLEAARTAQTL